MDSSKNCKRVLLMSGYTQMNMIAHIHSDFQEKFGIPRQSGLVDTRAAIIFEKEYRNPDAFRGLGEYSHLWILWEFSEAIRKDWSPTVRPPRLGGNKRVGVFATRSPFRPNPIGLSCVKLERIELHDKYGPVLHILGGDMLDGTPIYDIKPYLPYADSYPDASGGFTQQVERRQLQVIFPEHLLLLVPEEKRASLRGVLAQDPRPAYQNDPVRIYGMAYAGLDISFRVDGDVLEVCDVKGR